LDQKLITKQMVEEWLNNWVKTLKIKYWQGKIENISVEKLNTFFEDVQKAQLYSISSAKEWKEKAIKWKDGKDYINYEAISDYANETLKHHETKWLKKFIATAEKYMWAKENGTDSKSQIFIRKLEQNFWINPKTVNWCWAFIWQVLIESWYFKSVRELRKHVKYPDVSSNYLNLGYFPGHIGIFVGWDTMISWNSKNMVRYGKVNYEKLVWWIMPSDIWNPNAVHFYHKWDKQIPVGALLVFKRGNRPLEKRIASLAWRKSQYRA
jgi:hypothetical protein